MDLTINLLETKNIMEVLASGFNSKPVSTGAEISVEIPDMNGYGSIKGIDFLDGISMLQFDCFFHNNLVIRLDKKQTQTIWFIYCMIGELLHVLGPEDSRYKLTNMTSSIANGPDINNQSFMMPSKTKIVCHLVIVQIDAFYPKVKKYLHTVPQEFAKLFKQTENKKKIIYSSNYSLNISECLNEIKTSNHEGLIRRIFLESKSLDLIWMQIKQYKDDQNPQSKKQILRKSDIELIRKAKSILLNDLKNPPDIRKLAQLTGTNENKLKKGFKKLYDKSIGGVLRDERLMHAKMLLIDENKSIKEIADAVGYSSKSSFSKRFKLKFGVVPSEFLNRYKQ